jgi:hypothetical protein
MPPPNVFVPADLADAFFDLCKRYPREWTPEPGGGIWVPYGWVVKAYKCWKWRKAKGLLSGLRHTRG